MNPAVNFCLWIYRRLARAFPHEFQILYGADVIQLGEDCVLDIWNQHGFVGLLRLLGRLTLCIPVEYASELRRDLAYALRALTKSAGFAAVGIISLGLGIGVTTAVFSEINALMLRDMPAARSPKQLVMARGISYPYFEQYRDRHDLFAGAAAVMQAVPFGVALDPSSKPERIFGQIVSPEYFSVFGVGPSLGRVFDPSIDKPGEPALVVVSERFWRSHLHADPSAIGRVIRLNGHSATIAGVAAKDFLGVMPVIAADLFLLSTAPPSTAPELAGDVTHNSGAKMFNVVFRLAPGVTMESAEAALDTLARHLDESTLDPERNRKGQRVHMLPAGTVMPMDKQLRPVIFGMYGVLMGLLLTIACMNLANMLLARGAARRKEIAIRLAIGASRFRLIRQLVIESLVIALAGGLAGFLFGDWLAHLVSQVKLPGAIPWQFDIRPDSTVLVFTVALSIIAGLGFGLAPAFAATKADVAPTLKEGGSGLRAHRRFGLRNILVVCQVAGSLALLLICGFLVLGYNRGSQADVPFDPSQLYLFSIDPIRDGYTPDQAAAFFDNLPDRLRGVGAVQNVALAAAPPFGGDAGMTSFTSNTAPGSATQTLTMSSAIRLPVGPRYFASLSIRPIAGREFDDHDQRIDASAIIPIILSETAAGRMFPHQDALGRRLDQDSKSYAVVGIVPDLKGGVFSGITNSAVYLPLNHDNLAHPPAAGMTLMVRAGAGSDAVEGVRREIASIDPNITVFNIRTLARALDDDNAALRIGTVFYGGMGIFGLILASIGLAGVTAYSVAQRRKEIGIRMALGARKAQVLRLVLREGSALVAIGSVLGFLFAWMLARSLSAILNVFAQVFQTAANDPRLIAGAPLLLAALAMLACYLPARKSAHIDPLVALREE
ncbi:MAG TPA: ABC transporter permease [Bryobacteraceae bacterium]|nr:ABC transporter permease [Bryobacteraceae bacterium]